MKTQGRGKVSRTKGKRRGLRGSRKMLGTGEDRKKGR